MKGRIFLLRDPTSDRSRRNLQPFIPLS